MILAIILATYGAFFAFVWFLPHDCKGNPVDYLNYKVDTTLDIDYEVFLPLPIDSPNQTWYLVDFLNLKEGNATWSVMLTSYGLALRVMGRGNASLQAIADTCNYSYSGFSLGYGPGRFGWGEYKVHVNASGFEEAMRVYIGAGTCTIDGYARYTVIQSIWGELQAGWQEVTGITSREYC